MNNSDSLNPASDYVKGFSKANTDAGIFTSLMRYYKDMPGIVKAPMGKAFSYIGSSILKDLIGKTSPSEEILEQVKGLSEDLYDLSKSIDRGFSRITELTINLYLVESEDSYITKLNAISNKVDLIIEDKLYSERYRQEFIEEYNHKDFEFIRSEIENQITKNFGKEYTLFGCVEKESFGSFPALEETYNRLSGYLIEIDRCEAFYYGIEFEKEENDEDISDIISNKSSYYHTILLEKFTEHVSNVSSPHTVIDYIKEYLKSYYKSVSYDRIVEKMEDDSGNIEHELIGNDLSIDMKNRWDFCDFAIIAYKDHRCKEEDTSIKGDQYEFNSHFTTIKSKFDESYNRFCIIWRWHVSSEYSEIIYKMEDPNIGLGYVKENFHFFFQYNIEEEDHKHDTMGVFVPTPSTKKNPFFHCYKIKPHNHYDKQPYTRYKENSLTAPYTAFEVAISGKIKQLGKWIFLTTKRLEDAPDKNYTIGSRESFYTKAKNTSYLQTKIFTSFTNNKRPLLFTVSESEGEFNEIYYNAVAVYVPNDTKVV